jgi:pimeloyl-ACP methyl ester carboxylesterase
MKEMKMLFNIVIIFLALYVVICGILYFLQERLIFFPEKLGKSYRFSFSVPFEEISIRTENDITLSCVLFKTPDPKGVIFYLHGNAGSIASWGDVATVYLDLGYDVFMPDYRGYGKSDGTISAEAQLFRDVQIAYDSLKKKYDEEDIVVLGYSIGTGVAAKLAALNHPKLLILQAPFYNFKDLVKNIYPFVPGFLVKYEFNTDRFIQQCSMPVVVFHGDQDEIIYYGSSLKLKRLMKPADTLITLTGEGHNGMSSNPQYLSALLQILK